MELLWGGSFGPAGFRELVPLLSRASTGMGDAPLSSSGTGGGGGLSSAGQVERRRSRGRSRSTFPTISGITSGSSDSKVIWVLFGSVIETFTTQPPTRTSHRDHAYGTPPTTADQDMKERPDGQMTPPRSSTSTVSPSRHSDGLTPSSSHSQITKLARSKFSGTCLGNAEIMGGGISTYRQFPACPNSRCCEELGFTPTLSML